MIKDADKTLSFAKIRANSNIFNQNNSHTETVNFYLPNNSVELKQPSSANKLNLQSSAKMQQSNECKLLKLIGNMQENIGSIIQNLNCICCGKYQFQKIVRLMMNKIYQLREERNFYKNEYQMLQGSIIRSKKVIQDLKSELQQYQQAKADSTVTKHKNTQSINFQNSLQIPNSKSSLHRLNSSLNLSQTSRRQPNASISLNPQIDESNLLQQSNSILDKNAFAQDQDLLKMSIQDEGLPLREMSTNNFNSIQGIKQYMKKQGMSLQDLQKYIQKINCMNQLQLDQIRNHKKLLY